MQKIGPLTKHFANLTQSHHSLFGSNHNPKKNSRRLTTQIFEMPSTPKLSARFDAEHTKSISPTINLAFVAFKTLTVALNLNCKRRTLKVRVDPKNLKSLNAFR